MKGVEKIASKLLNLLLGIARIQSGNYEEGFTDYKSYTDRFLATRSDYSKSYPNAQRFRQIVEAYLSFFAGIHGPHGGITMPDSVRSALVTFIGILALFGGLEHAAAQSATPLSAENSDPRKMGWMTGFPPPPEKLIMQPESDFFSFPKLRCI